MRHLLAKRKVTKNESDSLDRRFPGAKITCDKALAHHSQEWLICLSPPSLLPEMQTARAFVQLRCAEMVSDMRRISL